MTVRAHDGLVPTDAPLLAAEGLTVRRALEGATVLPPVDVRVGPGQVLAVTGASGAGKSTLLRALLDVLPDGLHRAAGTVRWRGAVVSPGRTARRWRRARCGWLAQDPGAALHPLWRVDRLIGEEFTGDAAARALRVEALMHRLGLPPGLASRRAGELSGGQAQRVALARALCADPELLVLDEPTSALDRATADLVAEEVWSRRGTPGRCVVLVTHDARLAAELADRTLVLAGDAHPAAGADATARYRSRVTAAERGRMTRTPGKEPLRPIAGPASPQAGRSPRTAADPAPSPAPVLSARGLTLRTPDGTLLLDAGELDLPAGGWLAVTGRSGSGKTTLLHALAGRRPPAAGHLLLHGRPLPAGTRSRDRRTLRAVQLAGQDTAAELNPAHTVGRAVARPLKVFHGATAAAGRERVRELLEAVGLPAELAGRRPAALSGGQRRRVVLARALAAEPDVLLLDEPTAGLDPDSARLVLDLLDRLRENGPAVLTVTHDAGTAARADRVLHLTGRRLVPRPHTAPDHPLDDRTEHSGVRPHDG
ncbi:ATP-binding cassette domain-containing protein [Streptomyces sp. MA15]|uniref:ABC transporter ATP-binding protein n=1 Tax=Streptomyces sp. MA15 TaxID=3055061 RepID=UPI0025B04A17|nr:ATP-binding cassette domain-containing protein [Streptomyces sp. MA15]MDN3268066.1 ATP-binding cassette domain-containing protein [Streptomyces sp. MA15]